MKRAVWLGLFLFGFMIASHAQEVIVDSAVAPPQVADSSYEDETVLTEKNVNTSDTTISMDFWEYPVDSIKSFRKQKDLRYVKNLDSLLKVWQAQQKTVAKPTKQEKEVDVSPVFSFVRILLWTIAIAVILFVIYRLFLSENGLFTSPTKNKLFELEEEPVTDIEYLDQQLSEAVNAGDYRLAVRYLYLQVLSKISEKGWIVLSPDKTNYQYVRELTKPHLKNDFSRITMNYDYIWYGDFVIERDVFTAVKEEFDQFQLKIKQA